MNTKIKNPCDIAPLESYIQAGAKLQGGPDARREGIEMIEMFSDLHSDWYAPDIVLTDPGEDDVWTILQPSSLDRAIGPSGEEIRTNNLAVAWDLCVIFNTQKRVTETGRDNVETVDGDTFVGGVLNQDEPEKVSRKTLRQIRMMADTLKEARKPGGALHTQKELPYPRTFQLTLAGYDGGTDKTDHLIKWVRVHDKRQLYWFLKHFQLDPFLYGCDDATNPVNEKKETGPTLLVEGLDYYFYTTSEQYQQAFDGEGAADFSVESGEITETGMRFIRKAGATIASWKQEVFDAKMPGTEPQQQWHLYKFTDPAGVYDDQVVYVPEFLDKAAKEDQAKRIAIELMFECPIAEVASHVVQGVYESLEMMDVGVTTNHHFLVERGLDRLRYFLDDDRVAAVVDEDDQRTVMDMLECDDPVIDKLSTLQIINSNYGPNMGTVIEAIASAIRFLTAKSPEAGLPPGWSKVDVTTAAQMSDMAMLFDWAAGFCRNEYRYVNDSVWDILVAAHTELEEIQPTAIEFDFSGLETRLLDLMRRRAAGGDVPHISLDHYLNVEGVKTGRWKSNKPVVQEEPLHVSMSSKSVDTETNPLRAWEAEATRKLEQWAPLVKIRNLIAEGTGGGISGRVCQKLLDGVDEILKEHGFTIVAVDSMGVADTAIRLMTEIEELMEKEEAARPKRDKNAEFREAYGRSQFEEPNPGNDNSAHVAAVGSAHDKAMEVLDASTKSEEERSQELAQQDERFRWFKDFQAEHGRYPNALEYHEAGYGVGSQCACSNIGMCVLDRTLKVKCNRNCYHIMFLDRHRLVNEITSDADGEQREDTGEASS